MKKYLLISSLFILISSLSFSQAPTWVWAETAAGSIYTLGMATDAHGNICVTGYFSGGSVTFGSSTLTNTGYWDVFIVKYDPSGNVLWAKSAGGDNNDAGIGLAIDSSGNIFMGGQFQSSSIAFGTYVLTSTGSSSLFLVKYDPNGNVLWAKSPAGSVYNGYVTTDQKGNAYIAADFTSPNVVFGSTTLNNTSGSTNLLLAKYDPNGNVLWAKTATSSGGTDQPYTINSDKMGNVYLTGTNGSGTLTFGSHTINLVGNLDAFVVKYDSSGNANWAKNFGGGGGNGQTAGCSIAADAVGNVYISGYFGASTITFGTSTITNGNLGGPNDAYFIAKYDSSGNPQWAQTAGGWNESGQSIAIDNNNNIYVGGYFVAPSITFGSYVFHNATPSPSTYGPSMVFLLKYNDAGNVLWAYSAGGLDKVIPDAGDAINTIAINNGNIYAYGNFGSDSITLGSTILVNTNPGTGDEFLAKLSTCGLNVSTSTVSSTCGTATGSATANASNGTPPYSYFWTNGSNVSTADSLSSGLYIVTVYDSAGCKTTATAKVLDAGAPSINITSQTNVTCPGGNTGSITISVTGGTTPYAYYWDNGSTNQNVSNLNAGPYQIEVTDASGCKSTQVVPITQPPAFSLSIGTTTASCSTSNGSATVTVSGGTGSYSYLWTPSGQTVYNASGLAAGSYSLVVTDASGCKDSISAAVENAGGPIVTVTNITHSDCFNGADGMVEISDTGGTTPYTYSWSNGATTSSLTAPAGYYNLTVTDASGCKGITSAQIQDTLPQGVSLCEVTVDTNEQNQVLWNRSAEHKIASYNIYRETTAAGVYRLAATVPYDSLTLWTDPIAVPESRGYRYKISEVDSCGDESALSNYNLTLHLSVDKELPAGTYKLIWDTSYNGIPFTKYYIYRDTLIGSFTLIDSVLKGTQTYTDFYSTTQNIYYHVGINNPGGCNPTTARVMTINYNSSKSNSGNIYGSVITSTASVQNTNSLTVYPNPANKLLNVKFNSVQCSPVSLVITDVTGRMIEKEQVESVVSDIIPVNIESLTTGMYFIKITTTTGTSIARFVKE
jgi:hypothetical protein